MAKNKLLRIDNVGIVVESLDKAISFFTEVGLKLEGRATIEGEWAGRVTGLGHQRVEIAMMVTPDGNGRLEISRFLTPSVVADHRNAPVNALGYLRVMFTVDDIDAMLARLRKCGARLVGEVVQYEDSYRLCYIRGPEGLLIGLAEQLGNKSVKTIAKPKNSDRTEWRDTSYHKRFGIKAAKEAERVLPLFEKERPNDDRPRLAIDAIKAWAEGKRELGMAEVRKLSLGSHAAARETKSDSARYAARAAGQAIATWHVPTHAMGASLYAGKAIVAKKVERLWTWFATNHRGHRAYTYRQTRIRKRSG